MSQAQSQCQSPAQAFNLIIEGVAYLNRVRLVPVKKGPGYLSCTLNALKGTSDAVEYVSIDCRVVGKQAIQVVNMLKADVDAKRKVLVGFRASDPTPEFYEFPDRQTGEQVVREGLKGRLLQITLAKVNGVKVDIPLVQRSSDNPSEADPAEDTVGDSADDAGVGSACEDGARQLAAA